MTTLVFTFPASSSDQGYDQLQASLLDHLGNEGNRAILDLHGLEALDSSRIRRLITLLRRTRETGGKIALHVTRPELLRTLSVTALDKLFELVSRLPEAA
ncbi:MAG: STAS domain-containing protein [Candidatus Eremiobacteraeota bacterium]|nr:STAS domain-containing protein [Candidatus Eremiobacteraeota bacterium]